MHANTQISLFIIQISANNKVTLQSLQDVTGAEFQMFMDFLKSLAIFGEKAPPESLQELIEIIESQADLDAQFNVSIVQCNKFKK